MRTTLCWAAPAVLFAVAAGCSHDGGPTSKAPSPAPSKAVTPAAATTENLVTLKVDGMT
jgi:hypothetical protein